MLLKDSKSGPAEGQVTGLGFQLHGIACGLDRILGIRKLSLGILSSLESWARLGDMEWGFWVPCNQGWWSASP